MTGRELIGLLSTLAPEDLELPIVTIGGDALVHQEAQELIVKHCLVHGHGETPTRAIWID